jgi:hypothetical protein
MSGRIEVVGDKPVPVTLRAPQIPHGWSLDRNQTFAVRSHQLTI